MNDLIKEMFEKSGMSQSEFAVKIGMHKNNLSTVLSETPRHNLSIKKTIEIADTLGYIVEINISEKHAERKTESAAKFECGCRIENNIFYRSKTCRKQVKDH